jgi:HTH-type transcriptional regulator/antitoxin HigA
MSKAAMTLTPIRTEADYKAALKLVEPYFDDEPKPGSEAGAHFDALVTLIEAYEAKHFPIAPPTPVEAIKFRMEQAGLTVKDLEPIIGKSNRVYEIFSGRRPLTLSMIQRLHTELGIPAEVLIRPMAKLVA